MENICGLKGHGLVHTLWASVQLIKRTGEFSVCWWKGPHPVIDPQTPRPHLARDSSCDFLQSHFRSTVDKKWVCLFLRMPLWVVVFRGQGQPIFLEYPYFQTTHMKQYLFFV